MFDGKREKKLIMYGFAYWSVEIGRREIVEKKFSDILNIRLEDQT